MMPTGYNPAIGGPSIGRSGPTYTTSGSGPKGSDHPSYMPPPPPLGSTPSYGGSGDGPYPGMSWGSYMEMMQPKTMPTMPTVQPVQPYQPPFDISELSNLLKNMNQPQTQAPDTAGTAYMGPSVSEMFGGTNYTPITGYNAFQSTFIPGSMRERQQMGLQQGRYF